MALLALINIFLARKFDKRTKVVLKGVEGIVRRLFASRSQALLKAFAVVFSLLVVSISTGGQNALLTEKAS